MPRNKNKAYTLVELVLVVTIIGILSGVGVMSYSKSRDKALSREAIANLKLIAAAEKIYKMEDSGGDYVACNCTGTSSCNNASGCNTRLKLNLNPTNWRYGVTTGSGGSTATITVTGVAISGCNYTLTSANFVSENYSKTSSCP